MVSAMNWSNLIVCVDFNPLGYYNTIRWNVVSSVRS